MRVQDRLRVELGVSRETIERLEAYAALLKKWNGTINLVSRNTIPILWERHILDSAQIISYCPKGARRWADLGSGAGLPGIVIAILAAEVNPRLSVICLESDQRKAAFLRTVSRELGLPVPVIANRIEETAPLEADIVSARALAPLADLLSYARRHLKSDGKAIFPKGSGYLGEIEQARGEWVFDIETVPSKTDESGAILILGGIRRA